MSSSAEAFLNRLHHPTLASIDLTLDRIMRLLAMLGSPHNRLPPVVHVAGTNGKGSLIADLQAVLEAAGYRVHRYISPHLVHFRERIVLAGREIDDIALANILKHMAPALSAQPATFFEATTAAAFLAFAEKPADVLLLETGLGGRLDATNVIDQPLLAAVTPISLDHREYLGGDLAAIASEKAGIIKRGVPCVVGRQPAEALNVLEKKAAELYAPLYRHGREWQCTIKDGKGIYESASRSLSFVPALTGAHQFDNAATAIACIDRMPQFSISDEHIIKGLAQACWPGRLQKITRGKYRDLLPPHLDLWLDGGHNPQGGEMLAAWLAEQKKETYLICGMGKSKDMPPYLKALAPHVTALYAVAIAGEPNSQPAEQVAQAAREAGMEAVAEASVENALQSVAGRAQSPAIVCICGSLYLAGKVLAAGNG